MNYAHYIYSLTICGLLSSSSICPAHKRGAVAVSSTTRSHVQGPSFKGVLRFFFTALLLNSPEARAITCAKVCHAVDGMYGSGRCRENRRRIEREMGDYPWDDACDTTFLCKHACIDGEPLSGSDATYYSKLSERDRVSCLSIAPEELSLEEQFWFVNHRPDYPEKIISSHIESACTSKKR